MDDKAEEVRVPVRQAHVSLIHKGCGGEFRIVPMSTFGHVCDKCGERCWRERAYPYIDYVPEE